MPGTFTERGWESGAKLDSDCVPSNERFDIPGRCRNRARSGVVLLEVMLACAIVGISLAGFGVALQKSLEASTISRRESMMRMALQSRVAELEAEKVTEGERKFSYSGDITVEQRVEPTDFRNIDDKSLEKVFRVHLRAIQTNSTILPLETEVLVYQP